MSAEVLLATDSDLTVQIGEAIRIAVSGGPGNVRDWVGIFARGAPNTNFVAWKYLATDGQIRTTHGVSNRVVRFAAPSAPGTYEVRFLSASDAGFAVIAMGPTLIVGLPFPAGSMLEAVQPGGGVLHVELAI